MPFAKNRNIFQSAQDQMRKETESEETKSIREEDDEQVGQRSERAEGGDEGSLPIRQEGSGQEGKISMSDRLKKKGRK